MPQKTKKRNVREAFLKHFVRALILNIPVPEIKTTTDIKHTETAKQPEQPFELPHKKSILHSPRLRMPKRSERHPLPKPLETQPGKKPPALLQQKPSPPTQGVPQQSINLGKITQFLLDPSVLSIECPGPGKNVLVNRAGVIQTAPTVLTKEEIETLMNEISEKTRIPLISGLFKAAFQDLILTAVVSEFVGTRFMIQKMTPYQKY